MYAFESVMRAEVECANFKMLSSSESESEVEENFWELSFTTTYVVKRKIIYTEIVSIHGSNTWILCIHYILEFFTIVDF